MATKRVMAVMGLNGQVELMPDRVVIHRHGIMNALKYGVNAKREIPLKSISEINFCPPSFGMGTIEFIRSGGGSSSDSGGKGKKKSLDNVVTFNRKQTAEFETLKDKVFELIHEQDKKS